MPLIKPVKQPAYHVIPSLDLDGITPVGQATGVNNTLSVIYAEGEAEFLAAAKTTAYKPLPPAGTWVEAGQIYGYNGGCVIIRQSHYRTTHRPEDVPALISVWRADIGSALEWVANERVYIGTRRTYAGKTWECIADHVTQVDWTPDKTPTLWRLYVEVTPEQPWSYPVAYKVGDIVTYQGGRYQCLQAHTSQAGWTPAAVPALWKKL